MDSKELLDEFDNTVSIESLVGEAGFERHIESSPLWGKFKRGSDEVLIHDVSKNIFFMTDDSVKGGPVKFVQHFMVTDPNNWRDIFNKVREILKHPNDFIPIKQAQKSIKRFDDNARQYIKNYIDKYTAPLNSHDYLTKVRLISPALLKQPRFNNCLRFPNGDKVVHKNALFIHRDQIGPCAYEMHNITQSGNLNLISKNSQKAVWFTDDIFHEDTNTIFVGEAAIDALSFATLTERSSNSIKNVALLSFGGKFGGYDVKNDVMTINEENPTVKTLLGIFKKTKASTILLGNDNDQAGEKYDEFFAEFFDRYFPGKFDVYLNKAPHKLPDWNDYLAAENYNSKTNYVSLAKNTKKLITVEAGLGKFKLMPSLDEAGVTYIAIPTAGDMSSKMKAVAMSFIHVMHEHTNGAEITYSPASDGTFDYIKKIEEWRRDNHSDLKQSVDKNITFEHLFENNVVNADRSFLKSWNGYTEAVMYPHRLANDTNTLIVSMSDDNNLHYYHTNDKPVKMLVSIPAKPHASAAYDIKYLLTNILKPKDKKLSVVMAPGINKNGAVINTHCELVTKCLDQIVTDCKDAITVQNAKEVKVHKYKPAQSCDSVLSRLASDERLRCKNVDFFKTLKKKIHQLPPEHECSITPMH